MDYSQMFLYALTFAMGLVILFDITRYVIPNTLNLALLALYPIAVYLLGLDWVMALAAAGIVLFIGLIIFSLGIMGGGDVKLLVVLTLWIGWSPTVFQFFVMTAIFGGALVVVVLLARFLLAPVWQRLSRKKNLPRILQAKQPVPYGIAIALAFLMVAHTEQVAAFTQ